MKVLRDPKSASEEFFDHVRGPAEQKYSGRYTRPQLRQWLDLCKEWLDIGARQVFVCFDNDQAGYAELDAVEMEEMAAKSGL